MTVVAYPGVDFAKGTAWPTAMTVGILLQDTDRDHCSAHSERFAAKLV